MKFYLYILYITWKLTFQTFHKDGGLPIEWFRYNTFWKWFCDYFPIILHKTVGIRYIVTSVLTLFGCLLLNI